MNEGRLAQRRRSGLISGRCSSSISVTTTVLTFHGFSKSLKTHAELVPLLGHDHFLRSALQIVIHRNLTIRRYILGNSDNVVTWSKTNTRKEKAIELDLVKICSEVLRWIELAQVRVQLRALVLPVLNCYHGVNCVPTGVNSCLRN